MASLYKKTVNGKPYWYLRQMARVDGRPKMVSERYLGSGADIEALLDAREDAVRPQSTRHLGFGDTAAGWGMFTGLDVAGIIDGIVGPRRADASASVGTYLVIAALNRLVAPCSKLALADWWKSTAGDRFTGISATVLDHRRFWDAMHAITTEQLAACEQAIALAMITGHDLDTSSLALDMTNFATYIDSGNQRAPVAQRGRAKQKRADLRLIGLGMVVTRDHAIPLVSHTYPGNRPDVTQFATMIDLLTTGHAALTAHTSTPGTAAMTVVFDAGQNSVANFIHLTDAGLSYVGSIPPSERTDLLRLPAHHRAIVDEEKFGGLTALETRRVVYGTDRRVILTHSPTLHQAQTAGFEQTLTKARTRLDDLATTLARGRTRRTTDQVQAQITTITADTWVRRVLITELTGTTPADLRLTVTINTTARTALETECFGKRILVTNHDHWPIADVVAAYRSQSQIEAGFRQLKDPHVVSFSPMHHWTDHNIRVHTFTCVLALQIAQLMARQAHHAGLHMSVPKLLNTLAGIQETVLIYPSTGGRPKARRMLTQTTPEQDQLATIFNLHTWAPTT